MSDSTIVIWRHRAPSRELTGFQTVALEDGRRLIEAGDAQDARTTGSLEFKPISVEGDESDADTQSTRYQTREMRAAEPSRGRRGRSPS